MLIHTISLTFYLKKICENYYLFPDNDRENSSDTQTITHERSRTNIIADTENNLDEIQGNYT